MGRSFFSLELGFIVVVLVFGVAFIYSLISESPQPRIIQQTQPSLIQQDFLTQILYPNTIFDLGSVQTFYGREFIAIEVNEKGTVFEELVETETPKNRLVA